MVHDGEILLSDDELAEEINSGTSAAVCIDML